MGFPARHQPVPADHCDGAIAIPDLLKLRFPFELGVPGDSAGGLPIRGGAGSYQDLFCPARLSNKWPLGALHPICGLGCKEAQKGGGGEKGTKGWLEKQCYPLYYNPRAI